MDNSHGWYVCSSHHCKVIARGQGDASGKLTTFRGILRLRTKCGINPAWIFPFPEKVMSPCFTQVMSQFFNILKCFVSSFRNNNLKIFVTERVLECPVCASFPSYPISIFENCDFESLMIVPPLAVETNKSITGNAEENVNSMSPQNSCKVHISGFVIPHAKFCGFSKFLECYVEGHMHATQKQLWTQPQLQERTFFD